MMLQQRLKEIAEAVPGDLDTDAEQDESDDTKKPMRGSRRDGARDSWSVSVAEIDAGGEHDGGDK